MEKSLFKKFEKTYLEILIVLEKAKSWSITAGQRKQIDVHINSISESYWKVKENYEKINL